MIHSYKICLGRMPYLHIASRLDVWFRWRQTRIQFPPMTIGRICGSSEAQHVVEVVNSQHNTSSHGNFDLPPAGLVPVTPRSFLYEGGGLCGGCSFHNGRTPTTPAGDGFSLFSFHSQKCLLFFLYLRELLNTSALS